MATAKHTRRPARSSPTKSRAARQAMRSPASDDRRPTKAERRRAIAQLAKNGVPRPLDWVQAERDEAQGEFTRLYENSLRPLSDRLSALDRELAAHPEISQLDPEKFSLKPENRLLAVRDREVGAVLEEVLQRLELAEKVAATTSAALLAATHEESYMGEVLRRHVDDELTTACDELRDVLEHARFCGSRLVVAKPEEDGGKREAQS